MKKKKPEEEEETPPTKTNHNKQNYPDFFELTTIYLAQLFQ